MNHLAAHSSPLLALAIATLPTAMGCNCPASSPASPPVSLSAPAAPSGTTDARNDRNEALVQCTAAYASYADPALSTPSTASARIAESCAGIYSEPGCAGAFRAWSETPIESRVANIVRSCRDAYCPKLSSPKPALCQRDTLPKPSELPPQWQELHASILALELEGAPLDLRALARFPIGPSVSLPVSSANDPPVPTTVSIMLRLGPSGESIASLDGKEFKAPAGFVEVAKLAAQAGPDPRVVIAADKRVAYSSVIALMDALKQAGIRRISFAVSGENSP